jgi:hypothetical protein
LACCRLDVALAVLRRAGAHLGRAVDGAVGRGQGQLERHGWIAVYAQCRLGFERGR